MAGFQDLVVWQKSIELAKRVYVLTKKLPKNELYGLVSQSRRSAVSIPSNIAEGHGRGSKKDFGRFLGISLRSLRELQTQLILVRERDYANLKEELDLCERSRQNDPRSSRFARRFEVRTDDCRLPTANS